MDRARARLLVVDPDVTSRLATHHALRALGCRIIEEASSAAEALALLHDEPFDLVITDWALPDRRGVEFLRVLRGDPRLRALPVVVAVPITRELVSEVADAGINGFLPRPFGLDTLDSSLTLFVGRRGVTGRPSRRAYLS